MTSSIHALEHGGDIPLFGGPSTMKLQLILENFVHLALTHLQGPKYGLLQRVIDLSGHQACRLRDIVIFL